MNICVASGKGGTGKTTVAVNLALSLAAEMPVQFIDADVEAPNAHLFMNPEIHASRDVEKLLPEVDETACTVCGACTSVCQFHAIARLGDRILVYPTLCHGCGRCRLVCPAGAISETPQRLGRVETGTARGIPYAQGILDIGQAMATPIIHALAEGIDKARTTVIDAPPGTGCPTIAALESADVAILVTEPTPFGLHDLKAAVAVAHTLDKPFGLVINRDGIGDRAVDAYCQKEGIPILMRIPFERPIAEAYAVGRLLLDLDDRWAERFTALYRATVEVAA